MGARVRSVVTHPLMWGYVALGVIAEVLNFVLFDIETASGLWVAILAIWWLVLLAGLIVLAPNKRMPRLSWQLIPGLLVGLGLPIGLAVLGFVDAFNHTLTTSDFVFEAKLTEYTSGINEHYLAKTQDGSTVELYSADGSGWDYQHFWSTMRFGVFYRCQELSTPAFRWSEVYDCGRLSGTQPSLGAVGTTTRPAPILPPRTVTTPGSSSTATTAQSAGESGTTGVALPASAAIPAGYTTHTITFSQLNGQPVQVRMPLPPGARVTVSEGVATVLTSAPDLFTISADTSSAEGYMLQNGVTAPARLGDGVLTGVAQIGGRAWARSVSGGVLVINEASDPTLPYATMLAHAVGRVG